MGSVFRRGKVGMEMVCLERGLPYLGIIFVGDKKCGKLILFLLLVYIDKGVFNRPGVARAVLQTLGESTFSSISSKRLHSQTVRARELKS